MRSKKTITNTITNLIEEIVAVCCGFILPRLMLSVYGSEYNGLINSINQFLSCAVLLRAGIGGVTRAALYEPLACKNHDSINRIMKATENFMKKIGNILTAGIVVFALFYPFFVNDEFEWIFVFSLFLIIGLSTLAESFFGITYLILLQADQKVWVYSLFRTVSYIINTVITVLLIRSEMPVHIVKLGSAIVFSSTPILLKVYVKKKYRLNLKVQPDNKAISQRWSAFWHQIASFVMHNTDIMVLTVFSNIYEVSVYSVYSMIANALKTLVYSFSSGLEAAFGNMIAKKEKLILKENLSLVEWIIYSISTIVYTCAIVLITSFVKVYTEGVNDVNYIRPVFAVVLLMAHFFSCIRVPYQMIVQAAGHYRQTKNGAITEAAINLVLSIVLVMTFGLVGVAMGTLTATIFRTIQYSKYVSEHIVKRSYWVTLSRVCISVLESVIIIVFVKGLNFHDVNSFIVWFVNAFIVGSVSVGVVGVGSLLLYKNDMINAFKRIKRVLRS